MMFSMISSILRIACSQAAGADPYLESDNTISNAALHDEGALRGSVSGSLSGSTSGGKLTAHTGAAEPAIAHGVFRQILLVIVLSEIEGRRIENFGGDCTEPARAQCLGVDRLRSLCRLALGGREHIDAGPVLRACVVALAHALGWIMILPERLQQLLVRELLRVMHH